MGGSSPVNAATTVGHTCGWSVGQGNAAAAMPMIFWKSGVGTILLEPLEDPDDPTPSTKCCPELAKNLDISLGVDCHRPLSSSNQNGPMMPCLEMATQAVHFRKCNGLCRQCSGGVLPQKMLFLEFTLPDNRKSASSENQTLSRKSGTASILSQNHWHMITRFLMSSGVSFCLICIL